ncbi:MAG: DUF222 domain-containing protein, partial [Candidatus Nanopelagicales bacterium]|nr:DUF222 domain-containing protein [Candidatus Nanopelagicales bacterium]
EAPIRPGVLDLLTLPAGPGLVEALTALGWGPCPADHSGEQMPGDPPLGLPGSPCACQVVLLAAWEAVASWVSAQQAHGLVTAAGPEPVIVPPVGVSPGIADPAREEIAAALHLSPASAANRIHAARELTTHPDLLGLVSRGQLPGLSARLLLSDVANLDSEAALEVTAAVAGRVQKRWLTGSRVWTCAEVRRTAKGIKHNLAPPLLEEARLRARQDRRVELRDEQDGMCELLALLPEEDGGRIWRRLTAIAKGMSDDGTGRRIDQIRADTLTDLILNNPTGAAGAAAATGVEVNVVVGLDTLLGLAEDPGDVTGLGPVPAAVARELAADGTWRAWVRDAASSTVISTGSRTYTPGAALARLVRAREPYCRHPGCRRQSQACDLDHALPWPKGATTAENLGPLCRRHHRLKTHHGWDLDPGLDPDPGPDPKTGQDGNAAAAGWTWRTPAGITITDKPPPLLLE